MKRMSKSLYPLPELTDEWKVRAAIGLILMDLDEENTNVELEVEIPLRLGCKVEVKYKGVNNA